MTELWASAASIESAHAQQQTFELKKLVDQIKTITTNKHDAAGQGQFVHRDGDDTDEDSSSDDELEREEEQRQEHQVPHSLFRPYSAFHDSGIGTSVPAQTSYAQSHTSFLSSNTEGEHGSPRVPPTPVGVSAGKPFQCYLCGHVLSSIKNRVDWEVSTIFIFEMAWKNLTVH